ncbi:hypothetical protein [Rhodococcus opacus]|uniref:hypothetical protein n=1 Tax=Rhodococcus opacus TaxID=37919 RepID=UPI0013006C65|nr:hypothetical protein [Rhodococcus opacus]
MTETGTGRGAPRRWRGQEPEDRPATRREQLIEARQEIMGTDRADRGIARQAERRRKTRQGHHSTQLDNDVRRSRVPVPTLAHRQLDKSKSRVIDHVSLMIDTQTDVNSTPDRAR